MMGLRFSGCLESSDSDLVHKMKAEVTAGWGANEGEWQITLRFKNNDGRLIHLWGLDLFELLENINHYLLESIIVTQFSPTLVLNLLYDTILW